ncbi:unnamed protein product [Moneuplotes crassus]|uniref:Uncharacterized protein n=1 Tax=Euplotes crassus TaxID=5936 RepID=A0AAD1XNE9_EUPCR|nr:unnamed protein product [Moneuplotes crassus]
MLLSKEDKKKAVEVSMKGAGLEEILESLKGSDTLEFKDGYLYDPFNDSVAPMKLQIEGSSSVPLDIIKNKKTIAQNMKMSAKMKRKAFSGPGGLRKSLDGEALDNRSLSLERKDFNSLNLRELDLVFAFASPLIFRDPITLKEEQLQVLNYREEFRRIDNIFTVSTKRNISQQKIAEL